jgi:hypothetical protein
LDFAYNNIIMIIEKKDIILSDLLKIKKENNETGII